MFCCVGDVSTLGDGSTSEVVEGSTGTAVALSSSAAVTIIDTVRLNRVMVILDSGCRMRMNNL